jgi:hypothetical protein
MVIGETLMTWGFCRNLLPEAECLTELRCTPIQGL